MLNLLIQKKRIKSITLYFVEKLRIFDKNISYIHNFILYSERKTVPQKELYIF